MALADGLPADSADSASESEAGDGTGSELPQRCPWGASKGATKGADAGGREGSSDGGEAGTGDGEESAGAEGGDDETKDGKKRPKKFQVPETPYEREQKEKAVRQAELNRAEREAAAAVGPLLTGRPVRRSPALTSPAQLYPIMRDRRCLVRASSTIAAAPASRRGPKPGRGGSIILLWHTEPEEQHDMSEMGRRGVEQDADVSTRTMK